MRILFVVASLLCAGLPVMAAAPPPLSDAGKARLAPLFDAYAALDKELAALPPAKTDAEKILRLKRRDDLGRVVYRQIDFVSLPLEEGRPAVMAAELEIERQDVINQTELKKILPARGWFLTSEIGADAAVAAAQIVHHATNADMPFVRQVLASMKSLLPTGDVEKFDYAMLTDRVAVVDGVRQTYGTQFICNDFKWILYPVDDEAGVEARRKDMGIGITLADQKTQFATRSCPIAQYGGPIPK
jgi:hypothetical protein